MTIELLKVVLELLYVTAGLFGCYLVMKKRRAGWMVWLLSTPPVLLLMYLKQLYLMIPLFFVYARIDWRGWTEWKEK